MALKLDFSNVEQLSFEPVPEGSYFVRVHKVTETTSKAGNNMWNLQLMISDGEYTGRIIFDSLVFTDKAMWKVQQALIAFNIIDSDSTEVEVEPSDLYGAECFVLATIESQEGYEDKNRVKTYTSL